MQSSAQSSFGTDVTRLASGAGVTFAGRLAGSGLQILTQVALARLLGPEAFGLYAIGWTILRMGEFVSTFGFDSGVVRFASQYWARDNAAVKHVLVRSLTFSLVTGSVTGVALFVASSWLANDVFRKPDLAPVLRLFALAFPLLAGLRVSAAATRASQQMRFAVLAEDVSRPAVNLLLVLVFYALGFGLTGSVIASVLALGVAFALALHYVRQLFSRVLAVQEASGFKTRELLTFSIATALAVVSGMFISWIDRLFIGYYRPAAEVGVYQAVSQFAVVFLLTLSAINAIFTPMIANLYHSGEPNRLAELFKIGTKWALYLSLPVFLIICSSSTEILAVVFGEPYASGGLALIILAVAQLVNVGTGSVGFMLMMTGHQNIWLIISWSMLFMGIVLNALLVPTWGINGAAIATGTAMSALYIGGLIFVRRLLGTWPYDRRYLKGILATSLTVAALLLLQTIRLTSPVLHVLAVSATSIGVFGGILLLLGLDAEDREFMRLLLRRLQVVRTGVVAGQGN